MNIGIYLRRKLFTFEFMKKLESEELSKRVVTFYNNEGGRVMKLTAARFKKEKVPERTIYNIISKYLKYNAIQFRPKSGRPRKISNQQLQSLVKSVENRVGVSQRRLARRFNVTQSTISRNLKTRTSVRVYKRRSAPKYTSTDQENRARMNSLKLYKRLSPTCNLILDDEKYFSLSGNVPGNNRFYSSNPSSTPANVKYRQRQKYEPQLLVWLAISPKGVSFPYLHRSKIAIRQDTYLNDCIRRRLLPFIATYHHNDEILFWPDLASSHYAQSVQDCLVENNVPYVTRSQNPPNIPQNRPIESLWSVIEQSVYQGGWEAKNLDQLANRIKAKIKTLYQKVVTHMIQGVRSKLLKMYRKGVFSIC